VGVHRCDDEWVGDEGAELSWREFVLEEDHLKVPVFLEPGGEDLVVRGHVYPLSRGEKARGGEKFSGKLGVGRDSGAVCARVACCVVGLFGRGF
jgi:hypothetical protein